MPPKTAPHIGYLTLTLMTSALFMTLRNMPMMAQTGMQMIFFNFVTVFAFLIPIALVSAELATAWPHGGVFFWVREAFGPRLGFTAVWLQWVQSVFGVTSIMAYAAASLAYVFDPELGSNPKFIVAVILVVYWAATLANCRGTKLGGLISSVCVSVGVFLPTLLLIGCTAVYVAAGKPIHLDCSGPQAVWLPSVENASSFVLFLSFIFGFVGVEVSASVCKRVKNVQRTYPAAVFTAAFLGFVLTLLGGLAVGILIPEADISDINGAVQSFQALFKAFGISWALPLAAFLVFFGAAGQVSTWIAGPVHGVWSASRHGHLPRFFQKANKHDMPQNMMFVQAGLISLMALSFLLAENVNQVFLVLTNIAVLLYAIMYAVMFLAHIHLRRTKPDVPRPYKVPGGSLGLVLITVPGLATSLACFIIGFMPVGIGAMPVTIYEAVMAGAVILMLGAPLVIEMIKKPEWDTLPEDAG